MLLSRTFENKSRNQTLDVAKGIAIILVVYGHAIQIGLMPTVWLDADAARQDFGVWRYIYSFHMPFFFLISGITYKKHETQYVLTESLRLIVIAQLTSIAGLLLRYVFLYPDHDKLTFVDNILTPLLMNYNFSIIVTWFLVSLAIVRVAYHFFDNGDIKTKALIIYFLLSAFTLNRINSTQFFQAGSLLPGFIFFCVGRWISKLGFERKDLPLYLSIPLLVALAFATYVLEISNNGCLFSYSDHCDRFRNGFAVIVAYGEIGFVPSFFLAAVSGSLMLLFLAQFIRSNFAKVSCWLALIGAFSLELLVLNGFFFKIFQIYFKALANFETLPTYAPLIFGACSTAIQVAIFLWYLKLNKVLN